MREFHQRNKIRNFYFDAYDSSGNAIVLTSATGVLSKDGAAFATTTNLPVSVASGLHYVQLTATETDADSLSIKIQATNSNYVPNSIISSAVFEQSRVSIGGSVTGQPVISIFNTATGTNVHGIKISATGAAGVYIETASSGNYAIRFEQVSPTGFSMFIDGTLPEPTLPVDKDSYHFFDYIAFIGAMMMNKRILNKDTLTDSLYARDNTTVIVARSVSDDGTSQTMSQTD